MSSSNAYLPLPIPTITRCAPAVAAILSCDRSQSHTSWSPYLLHLWVDSVPGFVGLPTSEGSHESMPLSTNRGAKSLINAVLTSCAPIYFTYRSTVRLSLCLTPRF
jgi:hypothetical protein